MKAWVKNIVCREAIIQNVYPAHFTIEQTLVLLICPLNKIKEVFARPGTILLVIGPF